MPCKVCGGDPHIMIRRGTDICSENCDKEQREREQERAAQEGEVSSPVWDEYTTTGKHHTYKQVWSRRK